MAKRKITVTVDEDLVEVAQSLGSQSLSGIVNSALSAEIDRRARAAALARQLAEWDTQFGPVEADAVHDAAAAFDDLDALGPAEPHPQGRRPGAGNAGAA